MQNIRQDDLASSAGQNDIKDILGIPNLSRPVKSLKRHTVKAKSATALQYSKQPFRRDHRINVLLFLSVELAADS